MFGLLFCRKFEVLFEAVYKIRTNIEDHLTHNYFREIKLYIG
jgi:hypothetical protein